MLDDFLFCFISSKLDWIFPSVLMMFLKIPDIFKVILDWICTSWIWMYFVVNFFGFFTLLSQIPCLWIWTLIFDWIHPCVDFIEEIIDSISLFFLWQCHSEFVILELMSGMILLVLLFLVDGNSLNSLPCFEIVRFISSSYLLWFRFWTLFSLGFLSQIFLLEFWNPFWCWKGVPLKKNCVCVISDIPPLKLFWFWLLHFPSSYDLFNLICLFWSWFDCWCFSLVIDTLCSKFLFSLRNLDSHFPLS